MSKKTLSLAEIIAKRDQSKSDKLQVKYYESKTLGTDIEIRKQPLKRYMELSENASEDETDSIDGMNAMIYEFCPLFKTDVKQAMEIYGVAEPTDLPSAVFEDQINEMMEIIDVINSIYGLEDKDKDKEIKN